MTRVVRRTTTHRLLAILVLAWFGVWLMYAAFHRDSGSAHDSQCQLCRLPRLAGAATLQPDVGSALDVAISVPLPSVPVFVHESEIVLTAPRRGPPRSLFS